MPDDLTAYRQVRDVDTSSSCVCPCASICRYSVMGHKRAIFMVREEKMTSFSAKEQVVRSLAIMSCINMSRFLL